jgi:hypothetical protein
MFGMKSNIVFMCAGQQMEYTPELALGMKKPSELLFQLVHV